MIDMGWLVAPYLAVSMIVGCVVVLLSGILGVFLIAGAFLWAVEAIGSFCYRKMQCTEAFLAFLAERRKWKS